MRLDNESVCRCWLRPELTISTRVSHSAEDKLMIELLDTLPDSQVFQTFFLASQKLRSILFIRLDADL
jgi:hypothetical protein